MRWDPRQYGRFAAERARPFLDLTARIEAESPRRVVDLGCGPATMTALLAQRWPTADVEGIDSSPDMVAEARDVAGVAVALGDIAGWLPEPDVDVVVSNAALQWVPGHLELVAGWARALPAGGWLAFQVPGNFAQPAHTLLRELAGRWGVADVLNHHDAVHPPEVYASTLLDAGLAVDAWETTYLHVLTGANAVLEWLRGTGLRPVLEAVGDPDGFCAELAPKLAAAYPPGPYGTLFAFRRIFAVATSR